MRAALDTTKCGTHACDCLDPIGNGANTRSPVLRAGRGHVAARLAALRVEVGARVGARPGEVVLDSERWASQLAAVHAALSPSERAVVRVDLGEQESVDLDTAMVRARTPWLPSLIDHDGLFMHFQPIVDLLTGEVAGREALVRGRVGGDTVSGGQIVEAATAHGAMFALDVRARTLAIEQGGLQLGPDETLFINFNPSSIYDPEVCLRTTWAAARRAGVPLSRVCFEVVETERYPDLDFLRRILDRYRAEGAQVALDDLGSGYASLAYLHDLRPDVVKLDRGLIDGVAGNGARQSLVAALIDYAHELGIRVVAEGIETTEDLAVVRTMGADLAQGYLLGRPAPEMAPVDRRIVLDAAPAAPIVAARDRALAATHDGVIIADATQANLPICYVNPAFERITGYAGEDIVGRSCSFLQGPETSADAIEKMRTAIQDGRECRVVVRNYRRDGEAFWNEVSLSPVRNGAGRVVQFVGVQNDVTDREEALIALRHAADHDPLTGLLNRRCFEAYVERQVAEGNAGAVLLLDLDGFKGLNDRHGHSAGDRLLVDLAARLEGSIRPGDMAARLGGDEFLVFLEDLGVTSGKVAADVHSRLLAEPFDLGEGIVVVQQASYGVALLPADGRNLAELLRVADARMYRHKRSSREALY